MSTPVAAYVGVGGNVGAAEQRVREALGALSALEGVLSMQASRLYRTPAWGFTEQPDFINAVVCLHTYRSAPELLRQLQQLEQRFGRQRDASDQRWGPRTLDLDVLLYADAQLDLPGLHVPHPRMHERAFVLLPLLEIAPDIAIPGHGPARLLPAAMATQGIDAVG